MTTIDQTRVTDSETPETHAKILQRPHAGWVGLMCRGMPEASLGPHDHYPEDVGQRVWQYRPLAFLLPAVLIAAMGVLVRFTPLEHMSVLSLAGRAIGGDEGGNAVSSVVIVAANLLFIAVVVVALCWAGPRRIRRFLFSAAADEEIAFRYGSEDWTIGQRISACLRFGAAHLILVMISWLAVAMVALVGAVQMLVYLRELKVTGHRSAALRASTIFHADFNTSVVMVIVPLLALYIAALSLIPLVTL